MSSRKATSSSCTSSEWQEWPVAPAGVYCLVLWLPRACSIVLSRKGVCRIARGWYVYTGSAKRNLVPRLQRHLRRRKKLHWHIDHLRTVASLRQIWIWPWTPGAECRTNTLVCRMRDASCPVVGFGASDCRCVAHLTGFLSEPMPPDHRPPITFRVRRGRVSVDCMLGRSRQAAPEATKRHLATA